MPENKELTIGILTMNTCGNTPTLRLRTETLLYGTQKDIWEKCHLEISWQIYVRELVPVKGTQIIAFIYQVCQL